VYFSMPVCMNTGQHWMKYSVNQPDRKLVKHTAVHWLSENENMFSEKFENENTFPKRTTFWKRKLILKRILKVKTCFKKRMVSKFYFSLNVQQKFKSSMDSFLNVPVFFSLPIGSNFCQTSSTENLSKIVPA
jgi:hypothetical protein